VSGDPYFSWTIAFIAGTGYASHSECCVYFLVSALLESAR
jgi:hypothetical protein